MTHEKTKPLYDVVVVGSNNMDMISKIPRLPRMGETLIGDSFSLGFGGKGANQAVMAARMKARVAMVTRVGHDAFGGMARENFVAQGINTDFITVDAALPNGVAPIFVDAQGRNMIVVIPGANDSLCAADVLKAREVLKHARVLICQLEVPDEPVLTALRLAREAGVTTILNPAPAREIPTEMITLSDLIVPNETEAELLTGLPVKGLQGAELAARKLVKMGAGTVIVTLGEQGALLLRDDEVRHFNAPRVQVIDTTGSGDAFIGSLGAALAVGKSLDDAIVLANQAAALSVTKIGTQISYPTAAEVQAFIATE